jgi:hypothetical protein
MELAAFIEVPLDMDRLISAEKYSIMLSFRWGSLAGAGAVTGCAVLSFSLAWLSVALPVCLMPVCMMPVCLMPHTSEAFPGAWQPDYCTAGHVVAAAQYWRQRLSSSSHLSTSTREALHPAAKRLYPDCTLTCARACRRFGAAEMVVEAHDLEQDTRVQVEMDFATSGGHTGASLEARKMAVRV